MAKNDITQQLIDLAEPVVNGAGYELVDLEFRREQHGWVVRVFIDHPQGISFDDCEAVSRELGPTFDVADPVPHAYNLEVSSPGIARPLRTAEHFQRFAGQNAKIALRAGVEGRRRFSGQIVDVVDAADGGSSVVVLVDGQQYSLPLSDIDSAHLVPDWDAEMAKGRRDRAGLPS